MPTSDARRWWALIAIAASVVVVGLDLTVLSLALPTLARDLHASTSDLQWFSDAYTLVLAAAVLPAGLLGDRLGRKKVLLVALVLFGISSAACAYATSSGGLIAARAVLGLGAAAIMPLSLSILPVLFTADERPKAIAIMASATFLSFPVGPLLGGWLLDNFWWGSVFLINVPVVVLALIAVAFLMPESRSQYRPRMDFVGVIIAGAGGATTLTYGFITAGQKGWGDATSMATILAGVVLLAGFVGWERSITRRGGQPLVDLSLFSSAGFTWGTILTTLISFALFGILFAMPLFFQDVRGLNALGSGLRLLPMIGGMVIGMIGGSRLQSPRKAPDGSSLPPPVTVKALVTVGYLVMAVGLAIGTLTHADSSTGFTVAWFAVTGLGLGIAMPAAMNAAIGALSAERSGSGTALITAMRQVGATIGVAVLGTVINDAYRSQLHLAGLPAAAAGAIRSSVGAGVQVAHAVGSASLLGLVRDAYVHGLDIMLWVCAGIALVSALLALAFLPRRAGGAGQPTPAAGVAGPVRPGTTGRIGGVSDMSDPDPARPDGLRERKKARTRAAIRRHALRLFREQGYAETTVEQIAEAAEVSPSTFFRYFPTKEDVVLQDDFDPIAIEKFEAQPADLHPVAALRAAVREAFAEAPSWQLEQFRELNRLTMSVPELRARALDEYLRSVRLAAELLAKRLGRDPGDPAIRTIAGAVVGVGLSALVAGMEDPEADVVDIMDAGLARLEALPL